LSWKVQSENFQEKKMNSRLITAVCLTVLVLCSASTLTAAQTKTDITLEGPWILYTDTLQDTKYPVLIAVSPGGIADDNPNKTGWYHTPNLLGADDGYQVGPPAVYCVTFGTQCAKQGTQNKLVQSIDYPSGTAQLLPVKLGSAVTKWQWASKADNAPYATVFILPMPDSYSTSGAWFMRFAKQYSNLAGGYMPYNGQEEYSIRIVLHYASGPSYFNLARCDDRPVVAGKCSIKNPANSQLNNLGALAVSMRSPSNNACDIHVRRAYPQMIALLDGTSSDNPLIQVINPAKTNPANANVDTGHAYDLDPGMESYRCLDYDPQGPGNGTVNVAMTPASIEEESWVKQVHQFGKSIDDYLTNKNNKDKDPRLNDKDLLLSQINVAIKQLDDTFPRYSQIRLIETLLRLSDSRADTLRLRRDLQGMHHDDAYGNPTDLFSSPLTLPHLDLLETRLLADAPTKSGNDCNAPLMVVN
jgi:hypothetical protein